MGYKLIAKDNDRLDAIIYKHYGTLEVVDEVLKANRHLLKKPLLNAGDKVYLPNITIKQKVKESKALW